MQNVRTTTPSCPKAKKKTLSLMFSTTMYLIEDLPSPMAAHRNMVCRWFYSGYIPCKSISQAGWLYMRSPKFVIFVPPKSWTVPIFLIMAVISKINPNLAHGGQKPPAKFYPINIKLALWYIHKAYNLLYHTCLAVFAVRTILKW